MKSKSLSLLAGRIVCIYIYYKKYQGLRPIIRKHAKTHTHAHARTRTDTHTILGSTASAAPGFHDRGVNLI